MDFCKKNFASPVHINRFVTDAATDGSFRGLWLALFMAVGIFCASCVHIVRLPDVGISFGDKLMHFCAYAAFSTALFRVPAFRGCGFAGAVLVVCLISLFGVSDEIHQSFTGRSCDFFDWLADTLGAIAGVSLYAYCPFYSKILETRIPLISRRLK